MRIDINEPIEEVNVGDKVKSFDFPGVDDCYVIGTVEEISNFEFGDCDHYKIRVEKYILEGKEYAGTHRVPDYVYPPVNGTPTWFGGVCNGVKVIK